MAPTMSIKTALMLLKTEERPDRFAAVLRDGTVTHPNNLAVNAEIVGLLQWQKAAECRAFGRDPRTSGNLLFGAVGFQRRPLGGMMEGFCSIMPLRLEPSEAEAWLALGKCRAYIDPQGVFHIRKDGETHAVTEHEAVLHVCGNADMLADFI